MLAGIMLGPSLLGWLAPGVSAALFPASSLGLLNAISQLGLVIYMFLVGLELNAAELRRHGKAAMLISHVSIVVPFVLASMLSLYLYPRLAETGVSFMSFALFMGAAIAITAFPVLARILTDQQLLTTSMGTVAITCAAVDDVTGWSILAYIMVLIRTSQSAKPIWMTLAGLAIFLAIMIWVFRRLFAKLERYYSEHGSLPDHLLALVIVFALDRGALYRSARPASVVRSVRGRRHHAQGPPVCGLPAGEIRIRGRPASAAGVLCLYGTAHAHRPGEWRRNVVLLRAHCGSGDSWKSGRQRFRRPAGRNEMARRHRSGHSDEHSGPDGTGGSQHGSGHQGHFTGLFSMMVVMALVTTFMTAPLLQWIYPARLRHHSKSAA